MQYLKIKELEIPINIKSYKNSKSIKIYFKGNTLSVTKPKKLSITSVIKIIKQDELMVTIEVVSSKSGSFDLIYGDDLIFPIKIKSLCLFISII